MQLNNAIKNRWSPRGFSNKQVTDEMLKLLFEAARWAPSSRNAQPWNYYYVRRENKNIFSEFLELLTGNNAYWANSAQIIMISVMKKKHDYKNRINGKALHDIGAANVSIAIQAAEIGLQVHQMGGFDKQKATEYLNLNTEIFEPVTCIAVGFPEEQMDPTEERKTRLQQHQDRKEINEFVFHIS